MPCPSETSGFNVPNYVSNRTSFLFCRQYLRRLSDIIDRSIDGQCAEAARKEFRRPFNSVVMILCPFNMRLKPRFARNGLSTEKEMSRLERKKKPVLDELVYLRSEAGFILQELLVQELQRFASFPVLNRRSIRKRQDNITRRNSEDKVAGVDWFRAFLKRNSGLSLRKPEDLSRTRAEGLCKEEVDHYFSILKQVLNDYQLFDKPHCIYNMDESGFPLNNRPLKIVSQKGKREVVSLTNVERGQNVTVVACCNAAGAYIPPMVIFKGVRNSIMYKDDLPPGSVVEMRDSGYINEDLFISCLNHFTKFKPDDKILITLDNHGSHTSVRALDYCKKNNIELLGLPPHTTHVLQPLNRTLFISLKIAYHKKATAWMHQNPNETINKQRFCKTFTTAWNLTASMGSALKEFSCTGIVPFSDSIVPEEKFSPSLLFKPLSSTDRPTTSAKLHKVLLVPRCCSSHQLPQPLLPSKLHQALQALRKICSHPHRHPKK
ncbi:hypothetical protein ANN_00577 [Periplaneta americana]|uniref:DDE-1 domain-containing protein n=1 Tax=Periplaneta americana TaxID=6978 RepID=A0ABQ8TSV7_PERAM|nr:hypothetical protein ANN_00577 [Periplaneta americana]